LTIADASEALGLCRSAVCELLLAGEIANIKNGWCDMCRSKPWTTSSIFDSASSRGAGIMTGPTTSVTMAGGWQLASSAIEAIRGQKQCACEVIVPNRGHEEAENMGLSKHATSVTTLSTLFDTVALTKQVGQTQIVAGMRFDENDGEQCPPLLVTVEEAAKMLRIGRTVIYQLMQKGALHSVKIGRIRRIVNSSIGEYVNRLVEEAS
jgi:excisionase family DNA binding protein